MLQQICETAQLCILHSLLLTVYDHLCYVVLSLATGTVARINVIISMSEAYWSRWKVSRELSFRLDRLADTVVQRS